MSSISGSDAECEDEPGVADIVGLTSSLSNTALSDSDDETTTHLEGIGKRHPKVFFRNHTDQLLSIYRCVLYSKKVFKDSLTTIHVRIV